MKRILSLMLVAMLLVGCMSIVASAEGPRSGSVTFKLGKLTSVGGNVSATNATITSISGIGHNGTKVGMADSNNKNVSVSFTVNFTVADDFCGDVTITFTQDDARKTVYNDDKSFKGFKAVNVSGSKTYTFDHEYGKATKISDAVDCQTPEKWEAVCKHCGAKTTTDGELGSHKWGDWITDTDATCHTDGTKHKECSVCGETKDGTIPATGKHVAGSKWHIGEKTHWHVCTTDGCGEKLDQAKHTGKWKTVTKPTTTKEGKEEFVCTVCGYETTRSIDKLKEPNKDLPVVDMGDTTPYGTYNAMVFAAAVIILFTVYALISKRKSVK